MSNQQLEFQFVHTAKQREQLLLDVQFGRRNSVLMAALLREIARYRPGECYPSQATLALAYKVSEKTIQRALKALQELDLVAVQPRGREFRNGHKTINHYFINWTALERCVLAQTHEVIDSPAEAPIGQSDVLPTDRTVVATDRTVRPDRSDSCAVPIGQLGPTDRTARCPTIGLIENQIDKTTTHETSVVVVSSCGVAQAEEAVARARQRGLDDAAILRLVELWRELPDDERVPGTLYNWLAVPGSFQEPVKRWRFRDGLQPAGERKRADLIQYAKRRGWSHETTQQAIERLEEEFLSAEVPT